jgi:Ca-activated chloride channel family protein
MALLLLETRQAVIITNDLVLLRPELLWLALLILPLLFLGSRRLMALARWRRRTALLLQTLSALLLVVAVAEPARALPNSDLNVVVVLDNSASLSKESRDQAIAYAQGILQSASPTDHLHFISTAAEATLLTNEEVADGSWATTDDGPQTADNSIQNSTDLAAGLRLAGSLLPDSGRRRVIVVSDGWETQGNAADEARRLTQRGIALSVVPLTALGNPEIIVRSLGTPPYVRVGDSINSYLGVYSTIATTATLRISVDGAAPVERPIELKPGENRIPLDQTAQVEGFHSISVSVQGAADTATENNATSSTVVIKPQPHVLVLEDRAGEGTNIAAALRTRQMTVDVRPSSSVPSQLKDLDAYDSIVLADVAATSLTLDQQRTIQEYVRRNGRGLVAIGGQTSYALGGYLDSVLDEVLPVSSKPAPRPEQGQTALILVMDRSASMDEYRGQSGIIAKFAMAKEAARLAVDTMRPGDTMGILSFDTETLWTVPPRVISGDNDKEEIKGLISNIELGGGTDIYPAVEKAAQAIKSVNASSKHLVLLTDGREYHSPDYATLLAQIRADNVTLSCIAIGTDADRDLLTRLAKLGEGRYYFTERPENIPKIVFKELDLALKQGAIEGVVQPHMGAASPILRGFQPQALPQLGGYNITTPKDESLVALTSDQGHPLLAQWNYGLGRVAAFTSEAGPRWAEKWLAWDAFTRFWSQTVRWTMQSPINPQLQPSVSVGSPKSKVQSQLGISGLETLDLGLSTSGVARIVVESLNPDNSFADLADVTAGIRAPSGAVTTTVLVQTAPGRYEANVPLSEPGAYEVRVTRAEQGSQPAITESAGFSVPLSQEMLNAGTNDRLLKRLSPDAPYLSLNDPKAALDPTGLPPATSDHEPLWGYFLAPALVLLLASVAVRRLAFGFRRRT